MVPYLSPIVLRKEVESLLSLDGPEFLGRDELLNDKPIIYWNLVWYLNRLYLPTYLPLLKLKAFTKTRPDLNKVCIIEACHNIRDIVVSHVRYSVTALS
jgi:hypothetical protein